MATPHGILATQYSLSRGRVSREAVDSPDGLFRPNPTTSNDAKRRNPEEPPMTQRGDQRFN
jgi:hypothetical protein